MMNDTIPIQRICVLIMYFIDPFSDFIIYLLDFFFLVMNGTLQCRRIAQILFCHIQQFGKPTLLAPIFTFDILHKTHELNIVRFSCKLLQGGMHIAKRGEVLHLCYILEYIGTTP